MLEEQIAGGSPVIRYASEGTTVSAAARPANSVPANENAAVTNTAQIP
jgi:hypothetical protein